MPYKYLKQNVKIRCVIPPMYTKKLIQGNVYTGDLILTSNVSSPERWIVQGFYGNAFIKTRFIELPGSLNINSKTI